MRALGVSAISLLLIAGAALAQSLGDLARKERERKAQMPKADVTVTTDEVRSGKVDVSPRLDPARKGDLNYLLELLSHPAVSPELLGALLPLKDRALPKLVSMLGSAEPLKRVAPATALLVLGASEGLPPVARLLSEASEAAAATSVAASSEEAFRQKLQAGREANYALNATKFGVWRFTEGSALAPEQVVERLAKGPAIEIVGGVDNGQRIFNRALRDKDSNLRLAAISLIRVAAEGNDFGFRFDQPPEQNQSAIQEITTFLTTERSKVISQLGTKAR